jgi:hypothetical protein
MLHNHTRAAVCAVGAILLAPIVAAQHTAPGMTAAQKIANASSAAPQEIASRATILDWPASDTAQASVLRAGTNGWVCYPDFPGTPGNDPMCLDKPWQSFVQAMLSHKPPAVSTLGISYMIAPGGVTGSNTDPYATGPKPDNQWGTDGPHVMLIVPDTAALQGLPTARQANAPFVMWSGTPYAHIMVPVPAQATPQH